MKYLFFLFLFLMTKSTAGELMIEERLPPNPFVIEQGLVDALCAEYELSPHQLLQTLVPRAKQFARPPISRYHVGVAGLGKSGRIYLGVNLEFPGLPLSQSVHAEQFLIANARRHGERELIALAGSAAPCGHCRQFLYEMGGAEKLVFIMPGSAGRTLSSLLPEAFGPQDLGLTATMMEPAKAISFPAVAPIVAKALEAAHASYAPYSKSKSGIAIEMRDGTIYQGSYLENAAFNPGLSPMQAALVDLVADMGEYTDIVHVVLAEKASSSVSHEVVSRKLVETIAPGAIVETVDFEMDD